jgi:hypothetical protein
MTKSTTRVAADLQTFTQTEITAKDVVAKAGRKNLIINGGFDVWQRGTSFTPTGADYMADRWFMGGGDYACTVTKQASTIPDGSEVNTMLISYTSTGTNSVDPYQGIEDYKVLSGKTISISCWVRTNISGLKFRQLSTANFGSDAVSDGQWNKLVTTVTLGAVTSANKVANSSFFGLTSGGAIVTSSGDYLEMTQFQLELGSVATDFEHRSYGEELALCQRYYQRISGRSDDEVNVCSGFVNSASLAFAGYSFPTTMRAIPSGTGTGLEVAYGGGTQAVTGDPITDLSIYGAVFAIVTSGLTRGEALRLRLSTGLGSYVDFDAEL